MAPTAPDRANSAAEGDGHEPVDDGGGGDRLIPEAGQDAGEEALAVGVARLVRIAGTAMAKIGLRIRQRSVAARPRDEVVDAHRAVKADEGEDSRETTIAIAAPSARARGRRSGAGRGRP